jgi:hypothetical protein
MSTSRVFQQFVGNFGEYSWFVLFAKAPIDAVSDAYSKTLGREVVRNVPVAGTEGGMYAPTGAVVHVSDSKWTIVFHLLGQWDEFDVASFAGNLGAQVLEFAGEDTSGSIECRLYVPGEGVTRYQTSSDSEYEDELYDEMAEYAEEAGVEMAQPEAGTVVTSYEELFESLGIRTVELTLAEDRSVIASEENVGRIERVDLVEAPK